MALKRPTITAAIRWIAENDEPAELNAANMADLVSVLMVADLFGADPHDVAATVVTERKIARRAERRAADRVDGYDRDDLGESPDY